MSTERNLPATRKKLRDARLRGDVAKGGLLSGVVFCLVVCAQGFVFVSLFQLLTDCMQNSFEGLRDFHTKDLLLSAKQVFFRAAAWFSLLIIVSGLVGILVEVSQVGVHFLPSQLWQPQRLSPQGNLSQLMRLSGAGSWVLGIVRNTMLLVILVVAASLYLSAAAMELYQSDFSTGEQVLYFALVSLRQLLGILFALVLFVGLLEFWWQRRSRTIRLRMTREEVRRELRESEGNPEVEAQRRQLHAEILTHELITATRTAKVVVTN